MTARHIFQQGGVILGIAMVTAVATMPSNAMPADAQRPENAESAEVGRKVAERLCSGCHAIGRDGESPNPKSPRFPFIAERYRDDNPAPVLIDGTVIRHPGMPEFHLVEDETDGLVAYIRRISRKWTPK